MKFPIDFYFMFTTPKTEGIFRGSRETQYLQRLLKGNLRSLTTYGFRVISAIMDSVHR